MKVSVVMRAKWERAKRERAKRGVPGLSAEEVAGNKRCNQLAPTGPQVGPMSKLAKQVMPSWGTQHWRSGVLGLILAYDFANKSWAYLNY